MSFCPLAGSFGPTAEIFSPSIAISTGCFWFRTRALRITTLITPPTPSSSFIDLASQTFENMQTARPIDQVDQAAVVEAHVVALHTLGAIRNVRHERSDFLRRVRICDVDNAQSVREPRDRNFG